MMSDLKGEEPVPEVADVATADEPNDKIYVTNSRPALHASMPTNITSSAVSASEDSLTTKVSARPLSNAVDTYRVNQTNSPAQKISRPPTARDGYATTERRSATSPKTVNTHLRLNAWSHAHTVKSSENATPPP